MTTLWETQTLDSLQTEEARRHNEQIRQKYLQLQNAEEAQLSHVFENAEQQTRAEEFNAPAAPVSTMPAAPVAPAQTAQAKTVSLTEQQKDLFTADTFRRMVSGAAKAQAPVQAPVQESVQAPVYRPVFTPAPEKTQEAVKQAEKSLESYSLTNAAKAVIAAVAAFVVLLITLIGINTRILNAKGVELSALEAKKAELAEQSRELAERIENATSEETIAAWAQANGWAR